MALVWGPNMSAVIKWGNAQGILRGEMNPAEAGKTLDKVLGTQVTGQGLAVEKAGEIWLAAIRSRPDEPGKQGTADTKE
jgi:hypothetical protein